MHVTIHPHEGAACPRFPKYRRNFPTLYNVIGVVGNDARKRGVAIRWPADEMGRDGGTAYVVTKETDEVIGTVKFG